MKNNNAHSVYIHIPFCNSICTYCDFPKLQYFRLFAEKYIDSLIKQINEEKILVDNIKTIYIGGGTPTSLDDDLFEMLLCALDKFKKVEEFTIECNPESLSESKLKLMKCHNVNRLSIGVESTDNKILKAINRQHTFEDVIEKVNLARKFDFFNINLDLIIGLPQCSKEMLRKDIKNLINLKPTHISCYSLTVNPNTLMYLNNVKEKPTDEYRELYDIVNEILEQNSYEHYEISNWAINKKYSKHNLCYWQDDEYYGFGLGAAGYINGIRYENTKSINEYIKGKYISNKEMVSNEEDEEYFLMLNLRTKFGICLKKYQKRFNYSFFERYKTQIEHLIKQKLAILTNKNFYLTYDGMMILDSILLDLFK